AVSVARPSGRRAAGTAVDRRRPRITSPLEEQHVASDAHQITSDGPHAPREEAGSRGGDADDVAVGDRHVGRAARRDGLEVDREGVLFAGAVCPGPDAVEPPTGTNSTTRPASLVGPPAAQTRSESVARGRVRG